MNIRHGITPRRFWMPWWGWVRYTDHRDYDLHRTFGSLVPIKLEPLEYNYDAGFPQPNQNADGLPEGCTGYAQTQEAQNFDKCQYKPKYTYNKTLEMQGLPDGSPCDIRTSMKSTVVYGVQKPEETTDEEAENHRQGANFNIRLYAGLDWFDSIRLALRNHRNRCSSNGTPWFPEFEQYGATGIVPSIFTGNPDTQPWHNHLFTGETNEDGVPYLLDASWQGPNVGDKGFLKFDRETVNALFEIDGTEAFLRLPAGDMTIQTVELTLWETILSYIGLYLSKFRSRTI